MAELSVLMRPQKLRLEARVPTYPLSYYATESVKGYDQFPILPYCL